MHSGKEVRDRREYRRPVVPRPRNLALEKPRSLQSEKTRSILRVATFAATTCTFTGSPRRIARRVQPRRKRTAALEIQENHHSATNRGRSVIAEISTKRKAVKAVEELPEEATLDDAIEKLILLRKIERGLEQREAGEGIPQEEIERRFGVSWRK